MSFHTSPDTSVAKPRPMRAWPLAIAGLAVACEAFAWWGLATTQGRRAFDEMAGMVPLFAGGVGLLLAVAALLGWWLAGPRQ